MRVNTNERLVIKSQADILKDVLAQQLEYKTITVKMNIELKVGKNSQKTGSLLKMIRDSVIQLSIRPILGMEVLRVTLTPDSVFVIDRMHKTYLAEDVEAFQERLHFNFYNFQALITNALFVPNEKSVTEQNLGVFDIAMTSNSYLISTLAKSGSIYNFAVDASNRIISTLIVDKNQNTVQWSYSSFVRDAENNLYPTEMLAKVETAKRRFDMGFSYDNLNINKDTHIDYSISPKYKKVTMKDIANTYFKQ